MIINQRLLKTLVLLCAFGAVSGTKGLSSQEDDSSQNQLRGTSDSRILKRKKGGSKRMGSVAASNRYASVGIFDDVAAAQKGKNSFKGNKKDNENLRPYYNMDNYIPTEPGVSPTDKTIVYSDRTDGSNWATTNNGGASISSITVTSNKPGYRPGGSGNVVYTDRTDEGTGASINVIGGTSTTNGASITGIAVTSNRPGSRPNNVQYSNSGSNNVVYSSEPGGGSDWGTTNNGGASITGITVTSNKPANNPGVSSPGNALSFGPITEAEDPMASMMALMEQIQRQNDQNGPSTPQATDRTDPTPNNGPSIPTNQGSAVCADKESRSGHCTSNKECRDRYREATGLKICCLAASCGCGFYRVSEEDHCGGGDSLYDWP